jgi:hypothetical protein
MSRPPGPLAALALLAALAAGCGRPSANLSGEVTYDGRPVESGTITFLPADGKGPTAGATVTDGRYAVRRVVPGPKTVTVRAFPAGATSHSPDDMAKAAAAAKAQGNRPVVNAPVELIPADAGGNNASIDVAPGNRVLDFHLEKPPPRRAR